ncbi:hypothetical protein GCM10019814_14270 [Lactococcus raffinolactis]
MVDSPGAALQAAKTRIATTAVKPTRTFDIFFMIFSYKLKGEALFQALGNNFIYYFINFQKVVKQFSVLIKKTFKFNFKRSDFVAISSQISDKE